MRPIIVLNGVLSVLALVLFSVDRWCDRESLLGTHPAIKVISDSAMEDFMNGQPVIPDRILLTVGSGLVSFIYEQTNTFWHKYPFMEVIFDHERVSAVEVHF